MKNSRFDIRGVLDGNILEADPCLYARDTAELSKEASRGITHGLSRSPKEWALAEPVKSATGQIDLDALAHWVTEDRVKVKNQIVQAFGPKFDNGNTPDGPSLGTRHQPGF